MLSGKSGFQTDSPGKHHSGRLKGKCCPWIYGRHCQRGPTKNFLVFMFCLVLLYYKWDFRKLSLPFSCWNFFFSLFFFSVKNLFFILYINPCSPSLWFSHNRLPFPIPYSLLRGGKAFSGESTRSGTPSWGRIFPSPSSPQPPFSYHGWARYSTIEWISKSQFMNLG